MLPFIANYAGGFIISKKAYEENPEEFSLNPVGFGPFQLDSIEPSVAAHFVSHDTYFRGKPQLRATALRALCR